MGHDRTLDHYGVEDATTTLLQTDIGRYVAGTTVQDVLEDLHARLTFIEAFGDTTAVFSFTANAVKFKAGLTRTADAWITLGGVGLISANAHLIGTISTSFTANAYFIEYCAP
jgi:hypothetical protein